MLDPKSCLCLSGSKPGCNAFSNGSVKARGGINDNARKGAGAQRQKFVLTRQTCFQCLEGG